MLTKLLARVQTPRAVGAVSEEEGPGCRHGFSRLVAIGEVRRVRVIAGKRQEERCLHVLSHPPPAPELLAVMRRHWDIENGLHGPLDVIFREDECRTRKGDGPEKLALLRRVCVNSLRSDSKNDTMRGKMMRAGWNDTYLFKLIPQMR